MELSAATTEAMPSAAIVAVLDVRPAEAPEDGTVNVTVPPATGSSGLLAVTTTARGLAKAVPAVVCWGVLPVTGVIVKPGVWKAPMAGGERRGSPRGAGV